MTRRTLAIGLCVALGALGGASCANNQDVVSNALNLNRPIDITFACYGAMRANGGAATDIAAAPQPTSACDFLSAERADPLNTPSPVLPGQENITVDVAKIPLTAWYGFILQSASGSIAIANWSVLPASGFGGNAAGVGEVTVLDADPLTPGKNAISVGDNPIAIETDKTGCFVVTANAGSCDLSVLDVKTATQAALSSAGVGTSAQVVVNRLPVFANDNKTPLFARPAAMVGEPSLDYQHVGEACPATLAPTGLVFVAYPSCHMVAGIDMSSGISGKVTSMIQFDAAGVATLVTDGAAINAAIAACPVECTDTQAVGSSPKPPSLPTAGTRPSTLAYEFDNPLDGRTATRTLAIGADNSPNITIATLENEPYPNDTKQMQPTGALAQVALSTAAAPGKFGVTAIALSPQIGMGGTAADPFPTVDKGSPGGLGQYVYAVASDATVRVVDVLGTNNGGTANECDTQIDPRAIEANPSVVTEQLLQCIPVGFTPTGAPTPLPRRRIARSAGIQLPGRAIPNSVAIVRPPSKYDDNKALTRPATAPAALVGTFAVITSTSGPTYIANVDDDNNPSGTDTFDPMNPQLSEPSLTMAHQLRDGVSARDTGALTTTSTTDAAGTTTSTSVPACTDLGSTLLGGPRATAEPVTNPGAGVVTSKLGDLPSFRQVTCVAGDAPAGIAVSELMLAAPPTTRALVFPDLKSLPLDENWTATWEGVLSLDSANTTTTTVLNGPTVREGNFITTNTDGARVIDTSNPFCSMGVEPYDIVQFLGCNPANANLDCPNGYKCYVHADTQVQIEGIAEGSCMLDSEADRLATACRDYLISLRRYTVASATTGELKIMPRLHELDATPVDGCTDDMQCQALADAEVQVRLDQFDATNDKDPHTWSCMLDPRRAPVAGDPTKKRCVQTCTVGADGDRDEGCDVGSLCIGDTVGGPGTCMEGVIPPQACMNASQRFEVRGHEAFIVVGDRTGYEHPIIAATGKPGDACVVDPKADPRARSRIPLSAPACTATNLVTGEDATGKLEANPCSTTTDTTDTELTYNGTTCDATSTLVKRMNVPAIRLRKNGMTLTMVDPVYPGDAKCPQDRGGAPGLTRGTMFPLTFPGLNITFHITDGYDPLTVSNAGAALYNAVLPVKVVAGPDGSIWVIDDGDFLSQTIDQSSTLGSVFRIESVDLAIVNLLQ
jgi:hypothetical protein